MKVEARNMTIDNVLGKGKYIIPSYQREYDWDDDNIEEFINVSIALRVYYLV